MIRFAKRAEADLEHIDNWITGDNGAGVAARIVEAILTSIELLEPFPQLGRPGRRAGTRELGVPRTPYTVVYRLAGQDVVIARVIHGAMQWPPN